MRGNGADLLVVRAVAAAAARLHIHQHLVPRVIQLPAERLDLRGLLRHIRGGSLEALLRADQAAEIQVGEIVGGRRAARIGGRLPRPVSRRDLAAKSAQARIQVRLLFRPIDFRLADRGGDGSQVERVDRLIIPVHFSQLRRKLPLHVQPVRRIFLDSRGFRGSRRAIAALFGDKLANARRILAAIGCFQLRQLVHVALGGGQLRLRRRQLGGPLLAGGDGAEQVLILLDLAGHLVFGGIGLFFGERQGGAFRADFRAHRARQIIQSREQHEYDERAQQNSKKT